MNTKMSLRTKLTVSLVAITLLIGGLTFASLRAMYQLDGQLERVSHTLAKKSELTGTLAITVSEMAGLQHSILLQTVLSDRASADKQSARYVEAERQLEQNASLLMPLVDASERTSLEEIQELIRTVRPAAAEVSRLVAAQQMAEALAVATDRLMPTLQRCKDQSRAFLDAQLRRQAIENERARSSSAAARAITVVFVALTIAGLGVVVFFVRASISSLQQTAARVADGAEQVAGAASQVTASSHALAQGAAEQAASLEETSASAEEIHSMVRKNAENSHSAAEHTSVADQLLQQTNSRLNQMLVSMRDINSSSEKISKIIKVIDEIAFQTNILALNAAVEAARAGEAGMGFAVVADEVRNLAQRCAQAAKDTATLIEESITSTKDGKTRLDEVALAMEQVTGNAEKIRTLSNEVNLGSQEQARGVEQISNSILQMEQVTQKTAAAAEQSASAGEQMSAQAQMLRNAVRELRELVGFDLGREARPSALAGAPRQPLPSHKPLPAPSGVTITSVKPPQRGNAGQAALFASAAPAVSSKSGRESFPLDGDFADF
jgi:methyl-accepting chemotaxis protein